MRSATTDERVHPNARENEQITLLNGRLRRPERRRRSAWRLVIAEKPEKREHQVRIHSGNSGLNVSEGYPAMRLVGIR